MTTNKKFDDVTTVAEKIATGERTSFAITQELKERIEKHNPSINAFITLTKEKALLEAQKCDEERAQGKRRGPLHGVPITVKDSFATKGVPTTNGLLQLKDFVPTEDASVVQKVKAAGAIILGKSSLPPMAMDVQCNNELIGKTNNPWDVTKSSGGSSGGSAAAVASGFSYADMGSDIGGSIRIPSSFCGIYGFKPSEHGVSTAGHMPGLDHKDYVSVRHLHGVGPLARSMDDLQLLFSILAERDYSEAACKPLAKPHEAMRLRDIRIAWAPTIASIPVEKDIETTIHDAVTSLKQGGAAVSVFDEKSIDWSGIWKVWGQIIDAECNSQASPLARTLQWLFTKGRVAELPTVAMTFPLTYKNYMRVLNRRDQLITSFEKVMAETDVLILPVTSTTAIAHITPDKMMGYSPMYSEQVPVNTENVPYWKAMTFFTTPFNVLGMPVVTMPIGKNKDGMPIGIQIIGKRGMDFHLLAYAQEIDAVIGKHMTPNLV